MILLSEFFGFKTNRWREYELDKKVMKIQKAIRGFQHFKRTYLSIANLFEQP